MSQNLKWWDKSLRAICGIYFPLPCFPFRCFTRIKTGLWNRCFNPETEQKIPKFGFKHITEELKASFQASSNSTHEHQLFYFTDLWVSLLLFTPPNYHWAGPHPLEGSPEPELGIKVSQTVSLKLSLTLQLSSFLPREVCLLHDSMACLDLIWDLWSWDSFGHVRDAVSISLYLHFETLLHLLICFVLRRVLP